MLKSFKYRIYPNKAQEVQIQKRLVVADLFTIRHLIIERVFMEQKRSLWVNLTVIHTVHKFWKKEYVWLKEVDKFALNNTVFNVCDAYERFFKYHTGFPKFKSKKDNRKSYKTNFSNNNVEINFNTNQIKLPKLKWIKAKLHRGFVGIIKSAIVSQTPSGKYFVSVLVDCENFQMKPTNAAIGIDLGIKDLVITSNGDRFENPKILCKHEKKTCKRTAKTCKKTIG